MRGKRNFHTLRQSHGLVRPYIASFVATCEAKLLPCPVQGYLLVVEIKKAMKGCKTSVLSICASHTRAPLASADGMLTA